MSRSSHDVTESELAVLQVLWDQGPASRRHIADAIYPGDGAAQYATVQKLLERLEGKGCVVKEKVEGQWLFKPTLDREGLVRLRLLHVAEQFCEGAVAPLVMNLVRARPLSTAELHELQEFLTGLTHRSRKTDRT